MISLFEILYHGSKSGLSGNIKPSSRKSCDFGKGFYLGNNKQQCCSLIADHNNPVLYTCSIDSSELTVKHLDGVLWVLFIMKNRGFLEEYRSSVVYKQLDEMSSNYDVFVGKIADDSLTDAFSLFIEGLLNFNCLLDCISELPLGTQTVCVTQKACDAVTIISSKILRGSELLSSYQSSIINRNRGHDIFLKHKKNGRSGGMFVDEFMEEFKNGIPPKFF